MCLPMLCMWVELGTVRAHAHGRGKARTALSPGTAGALPTIPAADGAGVNSVGTWRDHRGPRGDIRACTVSQKMLPIVLGCSAFEPFRPYFYSFKVHLDLKHRLLKSYHCAFKKKKKRKTEVK